ncbi:hypothetical protein NVP1111B_42 [Vibrio phage 1.111.B._10N.286.45.E6]|nr:hypothetical protein NVP1111A_42 [Vibrio phage 1.111.A._10N.286.45.E6]AUR88298.1 hypothetical protein NVP1111B_42 [Vibrio phage 1.111.B._10N.286.45.E6]
MSKCSVGVNIQLKNGKKISHKYYAADQLKEFVMTCDISDLLRAEFKPLRATAIDNWVLKNQAAIRPQMFAAQRVNDKGKPQPPRLMSFDKYYGDD